MRVTFKEYILLYIIIYKKSSGVVLFVLALNTAALFLTFLTLVVVFEFLDEIEVESVTENTNAIAKCK